MTIIDSNDNALRMLWDRQGDAKTVSKVRPAAPQNRRAKARRERQIQRGSTRLFGKRFELEGEKSIIQIVATGSFGLIAIHHRVARNADYYY
jgi:hypothetical protein